MRGLRANLKARRLALAIEDERIADEVSVDIQPQLRSRNSVWAPRGVQHILESLHQAGFEGSKEQLEYWAWDEPHRTMRRAGETVEQFMPRLRMALDRATVLGVGVPEKFEPPPQCEIAEGAG